MTPLSLVGLPKATPGTMNAWVATASNMMAGAWIALTKARSDRLNGRDPLPNLLRSIEYTKAAWVSVETAVAVLERGDS